MSILQVIRYISRSSEFNSIYLEEEELWEEELGGELGEENLTFLKGEINIKLLKGDSLIKKVVDIHEKEKIDFYKFK